MIKYFCDKCGKELPLFNNEFTSGMFKVTIEPPEIRRWADNAETESYILCYGCVRKLNEWLCESDRISNNVISITGVCEIPLSGMYFHICRSFISRMSSGRHQ